MSNTRTLTMPNRPAVAGGIIAVAAVYLSALLQGMTLVSFPALSAVLKELHGFSDAQYGAIFLPQVAAAIIGAMVGGALAKKIGLKALLLLALAANLLSQIALAGSSAVSSEIAYAVVLLGTGSLGLGFGLAGAPLNSFPPLLFPRQSNSAVVAVHTAMGLGLTLGPLAVAALMKTWLLFPMSLAVACVLLMLIAAFVRETVAPSPQTSPAKGEGKGGGDTAARSLAFWLFVAVAVLYAFAEGTFSNWAVIYLKESKHLPEATAALALSVFWGALVAGRLLTSILVLRVRAEIVWGLLPVLMIAALLALPYASGAASGLSLFALAGLGCSAFFPLTIALSSKRFANDVAWVSSMLTAALMAGVGMGSFAVGALREVLALENLYRISVVYPLLVLLLIFILKKARPE